MPGDLLIVVTSAELAGEEDGERALRRALLRERAARGWREIDLRENAARIDGVCYDVPDGAYEGLEEPPDDGDVSVILRRRSPATAREVLDALASARRPIDGYWAISRALTHRPDVRAALVEHFGSADDPRDSIYAEVTEQPEASDAVGRASAGGDGCRRPCGR